jgi:uncharacterized protein (DUF488 family)
MPVTLLTLGHGQATQEHLTDLVREAGVALVVDVRRFPGSRAHPHVRREALATWLPAVGVSYRWDDRLGGRRRAGAQSPDQWWRVEAFRAYAGHMRTAEFLAASEDLLADAAACRTAVLCSETLWWRCHRRLIADFCVLSRGAAVAHLGHDGRTSPHPPAAGARLEDSLLLYDGDPARRAPRDG